ncbi:Arabinose 5-phosphate isomerase KdsD (plasmid) [Aquicella lusitana]|uniref:arabinose-5-phosphate isomerase n=2 Tax=Aquicella lusitana TaxID=254246 RepID=A0A370GBX3_9COXI|nr:KpsF/GutQ family protein [Aquicella lusitana]VVC74547.1 Arabinose 5-phosphate isomerase KdsD [Aquicella lusitana]
MMGEQKMHTDDFCNIGKQVIEQEAKAIQLLLSRIDEHFARASDILMNCKGYIIVMGMGKSGHIGKKLAATFTATGSPSFFVHPAEAMHGDSGMITARDTVIMLSKSGETEEVLGIIPLIKRLNIPCISLTGNTRSKLAKSATINLDVSITREACPLGLAPTSSTTVTLVMGNALAATVSERRKWLMEQNQDESKISLIGI